MTHRSRLIGFLAPILWFLALGWNTWAQDINRFTVTAREDLFLREWNRVQQKAPALPVLPLLDCAIEYIRRSEGKDIVFRRGPIPLVQRHATPLPAGTGGQPEVQGTVATTDSFVGGLLVDRPRAGEAHGWLSTASDDRKYMVRAAMVPVGYDNSVLHAWIILERAEVMSDSTSITILHSEVFSHEAYLRGNEPMHFPLPTWEQDSSSGIGIPSVLEEGVLITLEIPRFFGFSQNVPEPFADGTAITYAVPRKSEIRLSIKVQGKDKILDSGMKEAGRYQATWSSGDTPDGKYTAELTALDSNGALVHESALPLTKDRLAATLASPPPTVTPPLRQEPFARIAPSRFFMDLAGGIAYQIPTDKEQALRNMFTHLAVRLGYRISDSYQAGFVVGQDSFHETPGTDIDIDRISRYGGVVGFTYPYLGVYLQRQDDASRSIGTVARLALLMSTEAPISELGFGVSAKLIDGIRVMLMPTIMSHFRSEVSTKIGFEYSVQVSFR